MSETKTPYAIRAYPPERTAERGPLAVRRTEGVGPPMLLIHGFLGEALSWAPLEAHLKGRAFISFDLPSHGASPKMRLANFAELATALRRAFDALDVEKVHLVGHSLGGALALALADTRPRQIASLTLLAPAGLGPEVNGPALMGLCRATQAASLGPWLRTLVADEALITDAFVRTAAAARSDPALRAAQSALADVLFPDGVQAFDLRAALDRVEPPTRILWGKADAILPWRHALQAPGRVALHLYDSIGHMPQIERPEVVAKALSAL